MRIYPDGCQFPWRLCGSLLWWPPAAGCHGRPVFGRYPKRVLVSVPPPGRQAPPSESSPPSAGRHWILLPRLLCVSWVPPIFLEEIIVLPLVQAEADGKSGHVVVSLSTRRTGCPSAHPLLKSRIC